jgi:uncharacterized BrkB/YihY/UPF0761 family membrane protein
MFASALGTVPFRNWDALIHVATLFAIFGAMLGTIMALDRSAGRIRLPRWAVVPFNAPIARTAICAALGAAAAWTVWTWHPRQFTPAWVAVGAVIGAVLGWWGWRWAKYIDF